MPAPNQFIAKITVEASSSHEPIEYSLDGERWQDSNVFTGLDPDKEYTVYCRDSNGCVVSKTVSPTVVCDLNIESVVPYECPLTISEVNVTFDGDLESADVTVKSEEAAGETEYRVLDDEENVVRDWQESATFSDLPMDENFIAQVRDEVGCQQSQSFNTLVFDETYEATSDGREGELHEVEIETTSQYRITAYGAQGGVGSREGIGGLGAKMSGVFDLEQGDVLQLLVGQEGGSTSEDTPGGGGGSFVWKKPAPDEENFDTDFSEYTEGDYPDGWEPTIDGEEGQGSIEEDEAADPNFYFEIDPPSSGSNFHSWTSRPIVKRDFDFTALLKPGSTSSDNRNWVGIVDNDSGDRIYATLRDGNTLEVAEFLSGSFNQIDDPSFNYSDDTKYYIRVERSGGTIRAKVWEEGETEPVDWMAEGSLDEDGKELAGYPSLGNRDGVAEWYDFSGSYQLFPEEGDLLIAAGGGGGYGIGNSTDEQEVAHAHTDTHGKDGFGGAGSGSGGTDGEGGQNGGDRASGGAGWVGDGADANADGGGQEVRFGGLGGIGNNTNGGYGGGGAVDQNTGWGAAGGGGGYSGGGGGYSSSESAEGAGGGGGSYNGGDDQDNESGVREGHGKIKIEAI